MEGKNLRKADIITSAIFFLLGIFILASAFQMPMKDSWGGVQNVWFVSPALFPLIIGSALLIMSLILFSFSKSLLGVSLKEAFKNENKNGLLNRILEYKNLKFIAITGFFCFFVYLFIPRVDFFLSMWLFLIAFITPFYYENYQLFKKLFAFYFCGSLFFLIMFLFNIPGLLGLEKIYEFANDILVLLFILAFSVYARKLAQGNSELTKKYRASMLVSFLVPMFAIPIFKFWLQVVMPVEGLVVGLMNYIRYTIF